MALMPFQPTPFFADKNRAFWTLQFAGWGGVLLLRAMSAFANGQPASFLVLILITTITGFSLSLLLSPIFRQLINRRPLVTWGATTAVLLVAVSLHAFIDSWVLGLYSSNAETGFAQLFIGIFFLNLSLLGAWSALYYAINFFLQVEEQADRLERLEAQATSAQLAMLRYQLNPHFLFNTLNSISTLVLLEQTEPANAMLTRLSGFLRHTLLTELTGTIPLAEEVETLQLYLDIERMRFEERLRTHFDIEPAAEQALLPAMLLQPLVENAIKYAVTPQEEGARITVSAKVLGNRLRVAVSDTGPGAQGPGRRPLPDAVTGRRTVSTGVGLPNIRNRLAQAYGEEHRFEIRTPPEGGFTVIIEIPYETAEKTAPMSAPTRMASVPAPSQPGLAAAPTPGALT
ncbi:histidine kinase [Altererythrobacter sp. H2]|uniref:sensor histidine kinase n=1 Tax=Altererythrobacter sp. H2 TaxID=3108391 RepID=UPI002B4C0DFD|nr:histidine kinase [Altererythrobacter sp. H2]WRK96101.1 histidine kinase [Altererythrobacter sp. H2]